MTQNIDHAAPLKPGEIRTHTAGEVTFQVMHVAGGSFTQARVVGGNVIATERFESDALRAYAQAIENAEIDALDDADAQVIGPASGERDHAPVLPLEAIAALRKWAQFQGDAAAMLRSLDAMEAQIKATL